MLSFNLHDNAFFYGLEAEGPHKGMPTLFVAGTPSLDGLQAALSQVPAKALGVYFGAGGIVDRLPKARAVYQMLTHIVDTGIQIDRVCVEYKGFDPVVAEAILTGAAKTTVLDWVCPVLWDSEHLKIEMNKGRRNYINALVQQQIPFEIFCKVYVQHKVLMVVPWKHCQFPDYDNNEDQYQTDVLLWEEKHAAA